MADKRIYVEKTKGDKFAVRRADAKRASAIEPTQAKAIERAKKLSPGSKPHVERVRHTSKGKPDQWRKA